ncbi:MAG: Fe-S cluster assembly sulfur transfer protein SufU [Candidatus Kerfeldbacteria bacterium]
MELYREEILEHYRKPHNSGTLEGADIVQHEQNTTCGDILTFYLNMEDDKVKEVMFEGEGCAISQAAASMLTDEIKGKTVEEVKQLTKDDIVDLLGIELGPTRLKCALLSLQGVTNAVSKTE